MAAMADFLMLLFTFGLAILSSNEWCQIYGNSKGNAKTKIVDGFIGIPKPIIADVMINGIRLGIMETNTILHDLNKIDIKIAITQTAIIRLINKFLTK